MHYGLTDQHSVEWILMDLWKTKQMKARLLIKRKAFDSVLSSLEWNKHVGRSRQRQPSKTVLHRNLPNRNAAQENVVVRIDKQFPRARGQLLGVCGKPDERTGVEQ